MAGKLSQRLAVCRSKCKVHIYPTLPPPEGSGCFGVCVGALGVAAKGWGGCCCWWQASMTPAQGRLHSFPVTTITNHDKWGDLK